MNQKEFRNSLLELGIEITDSQLNQLEMYYELLVEYNNVMNLTGITEHDEVYLKHFYDSLTICKNIDLNNVNTLCDMGTGAGFPGIVLKILYPHLEITLLDSLNKRINFLNIVIEKLELKKIETYHTRIEEYAKENREKFDVVTARAVAPTNILLEYGVPMVKVNYYFIAMKGNEDNEPNIINCINKLNIQEQDRIKFLLPKENSKRLIIKFKKLSPTPLKYPRNNKDIKNKPL